MKEFEGWGGGLSFAKSKYRGWCLQEGSWKEGGRGGVGGLKGKVASGGVFIGGRSRLGRPHVHDELVVIGGEIVVIVGEEG
jgi:hypothetical protein